MKSVHHFELKKNSIAFLPLFPLFARSKLSLHFEFFWSHGVYILFFLGFSTCATSTPSPPSLAYLGRTVRTRTRLGVFESLSDLLPDLFQSGGVHPLRFDYHLPYRDMVRQGVAARVGLFGACR